MSNILKKIFSKDKSETSFFERERIDSYKQEIGFQRTMVLAGGFAYVFFRLFSKKSAAYTDSVDPVLDRIILLVINIIFYVASHFSKWIEKNFYPLFFSLIGLYSISYFYVCYQNHFIYPFVYGYLVCLNLVNFATARIRILTYYNLFSLVSFSLIYLYTDNPEVPMTNFFTLLVSIYGLALLSIWFKLKIAKHQQLKEKLLFSIFQNSTDALYIIDKDSMQIIDCNDMALKIYHYTSKEQLIGKSFVELGGGHYSEDLKSKVFEVIDREGVWEWEGKLTTPRGKVFWANLQVKKISTENEEIYLARHLNITDIKENELRLTRLLKQLEQSNKDLKDYAFVISHDLRAPLRNINSYTSILEAKMTSKTDTEKKLFEEIRNSAKSMASLIEGVLEYSKVDMYNDALEPLSLKEIVDESAQVFSSRSDVFLHSSISENVKLFGNRTQLYQLFSNLINNAIQHNDKELKKISISCVQEEKNLIIQVADNGNGIAQEYFQDIFKIFKKGNIESIESDGIGIGLSIVKKIVDNYGGTISLESELNVGTTFTIRLPKE